MAQRNFLEIIGGRFGDIDETLGRICSDSKDGLESLRALAVSVRRLEAKLDRMAVAVREGGDARHVAGRQVRQRAAQRFSAVTGSVAGSGGSEGTEARRQGSGRDIRRYGAAEENDDSASAGKAIRRETRKANLSDRADEEKEEKEHVLRSAPEQKPLESADVLGVEQTHPAQCKTLDNPEHDKLDVVELKLDGMDKKLERIAGAVGVRFGLGVSEEEDRRRLKEKLKEALESATRNRLHEIESEREMWLEYCFGICKPDGRIGKSGSKYVAPPYLFFRSLVVVGLVLILQKKSLFRILFSKRLPLNPY